MHIAPVVTFNKEKVRPCRGLLQILCEFRKEFFDTSIVKSPPGSRGPAVGGRHLAQEPPGHGVSAPGYADLSDDVSRPCTLTTVCDADTAG